MNDIQLRQALEQSALHYRGILSALTTFDAALSQVDAEEIAAFAQELRRLMAEAAALDEAFFALLGCMEPLPELAEPLARRLELMQQVQANNRLLSEKIRGMMSVISSELSQARDGRAAMSGYRGGAVQRGGLVSGNF
ncbi:hypothetical protein [Geoalkalibacter sp.]|jgi:hypothetical protein|uniref:hypothetical protein n=1 Tax=Geoalkalibacter sp. TaxID=3041440 RepID=UPI00272DEDD4|nr:hypothetical protein [Geoalkalibacter sp.]